MPHILLKFISNPDWAESFLDGNLYMNTLYYFWNEYPLEVAGKEKEEYLQAHPGIDPDSYVVPINNILSRTQADMLEGTVGFSDDDPVTVDFGEHALTDTIYRAEGYQYCNVCCFYRLDFTLQTASPGRSFIHYNIPSMDGFGDYVVIIKDEVEFIRRISRAAKGNSFDYLCGNVRYKKLKRNGSTVNLSNRNHIALRTEDRVPIPDDMHTIRDCFVKTDYYSSQQEWRVALYRGVKDATAYVFQIGSLRDMACVVKKGDLATEIDKLFNSGEIKSSRDGYSGTISRREMQRKFVELGDNQMQMITFVG